MGARRVGGPKFRAFFSLSRRKIRSFLPSLGVLSWNFGGVCCAGALKCAHLEFSGCRVKPRRPREGRKERILRQEREKMKFWAVLGKGGPGGTEHDQTKTVKPPTHTHTQNTQTHKHTTHHTQHHKPKSVWPKSAMTRTTSCQPVLWNAIIACPEDAAPVLAKPSCRVVRIKHWEHRRHHKQHG